MLEGLGNLGDAILSGWIVTWPTKLLALIWLAWVVSWVVAAFWSGRTKAHVPTWDSWVYRLPILIGAIFLMPLTAPDAIIEEGFDILEKTIGQVLEASANKAA